MSAKFNFFHQWYPLTPIIDLRPDYPTAATVLGIKIVIWKPRGVHSYRAFLDQCPHRLAPLSEGRVDETSGLLMCSYHGWQFDHEGVCRSLPQADATVQPEQNPQLCAQVLPSQMANDLFWVWPDPDSAELATQTPLPLSPQIDASKGFVWDSYVRDLEYDWQTLVENVVDPSHVSFAHHGIQGDRTKAAPLPIHIQTSTPELIEATSDGRVTSVITFEPPCRVEYAIILGTTDKQIGLVTYCIPTLPGKCRIVAQFPRNFAHTLYRLVPRWWTHIKTRNAVLDGDMILLQQQETLLRAHKQQYPDGTGWKTAYVLPTSADRFVIEFRKWFDRYCEGTIPWPAPVHPSLWANGERGDSQQSDRRQILDRYRQHTQQCHSCRTALTYIRWFQIGLVAYFVIVVAIAALLPDAARLMPGLPLVLSSLLGLGFAVWLRFSLEPKFYFVDYIHVEHR